MFELFFHWLVFALLFLLLLFSFALLFLLFVLFLLPLGTLSSFCQHLLFVFWGRIIWMILDNNDL